MERYNNQYFNQLIDIASQLHPPDWLIKMHKHYSENGFYRPEDLKRVLGDSNEGVSIPNSKEESERLLLEIVSRYE